MVSLTDISRSFFDAILSLMQFFYVYILHNKTKNFIYIGYSENIKQRIEEHNAGYSKSTKPYLPLELIHYEAYKNMKDAKIIVDGKVIQEKGKWKV